MKHSRQAAVAAAVLCIGHSRWSGDINGTDDGIVQADDVAFMLGLSVMAISASERRLYLPKPQRFTAIGLTEQYGAVLVAGTGYSAIGWFDDRVSWLGVLPTASLPPDSLSPFHFSGPECWTLSL